MSDNNPLDDLPYKSPVQPVELTLDNAIQFRCHKDIGCFNECCYQSEVQLTPYDIVRLKNRFGLTSSAFLARDTLPFEIDKDGLPGVRLRRDDETGACPYVRKEGCSVYSDRPLACRYYPIGLLSMRKQGESHDENSFFIVKEDYCLGHHEARSLTIKEYRQEQETNEYEEINREWQQIILKKRSSGAAVGKPSVRSFQLFFLGCYNIDNFRDFVLSQNFSEVYDLDPELYEQFQHDDVALLKFAFKFLKQVFFGEMTIPMKQSGIEQRMKKRGQKLNTRFDMDDLEEAGERIDDGIDD